MKLFKLTAIALSLGTMLSISAVQAAPQSSSTTSVHPIIGQAPYLKKFGIVGSYIEGGTLKIRTDGDAPFYIYADADLDDDGKDPANNSVTANTAKWYIVDATTPASDFPAGTPAHVGAEFKIPTGTAGKKIFVSIQPTSRIGLPRTAHTIYLTDITKYMGQNADGTIDPAITGSVLGDDPYISLVDLSNDGLIDSDTATYKVQIAEQGNASAIIVDETNRTQSNQLAKPRTNTAYQVTIFEVKEGEFIDVTDKFSKSITWQVVGLNNVVINAPANRVTENNTVFTTQLNNSQSFVLPEQSAEESEQSTLIRVTFDNDPASPANQ